MANKLTEKQAKFVKTYLANGRNGAGAYETAYDTTMSSKNCSIEANKLLRNPKITPYVERAEERLEAGMERAIETYGVSRERNVAELARMAYANVADYTRLVGAERVADLSQATRDQLAAIQEITVEDFTEGRGEDKRDVRRVRIKLHDKKSAIAELNHMNGWVVERQEVGKPGDFAHLSDEELDAQISQRLKARGLTDRQIRNFLLVTHSTPANYDEKESA
jgi:phage terminase small subunit